VNGLVMELERLAAEFRRPDLVTAARWLAAHPTAPAPDVICHDLHPFNVLADGDRVTLLDWSAAMLGPCAYDVAFTSLLLSEPPLRAASWRKPVVRAVGGLLARQFIRAYQRKTRVAITPRELRWHQGVVCLRALVEVASWAHEGVLSQRAGHPWLATRPAFAKRLAALTGAQVAPSSPPPGRRSWPGSMPAAATTATATAQPGRGWRPGAASPRRRPARRCG
jgi:Ser/Thr protein kinase RdoA (MazF antagonist)